MTDSLLHIRNDMPEGLLDCAVEDLHTILEGPTLINLPGRREEPLFVSALENSNLGSLKKRLKELSKKIA